MIIRASSPEMYIFSLLLLCKFLLSDCNIVVTNSGPIQGVASLETDIEAFLGIPYAEPPIGELRFAKPVPKKNWYDVYEAKNLPPPCIQLSMFPYVFLPNVTNMSEDCLYLNVWSPRSRETSKHEPWPVIIFFHSGSFVTGSSNQKVYDGSHLASRGKVIVATINFRLGALGYFLTHTGEAEGSMAMYDQLMAIKWMKTNAEVFGGDPENIALMGSSSGAFAVSAHLVSPLSKSLFKRAIIQSGSFMNPYFTLNERLYANSKTVATLVGCTNETTSLNSDPHTVMKCLKNVPAKAFADADEVLLKGSPMIFHPKIMDQFLPKSYSDLIHEGEFRNDIDVLTGITEDEGSVMAVIGMRDYLGDYGENAYRITKLRAVVFGRAAIATSLLPNPPKILDFYMSRLKNRTAIEYAKMLGNMIGDFSITCNTMFLADFLSRKVNGVYFYKFGFRSPSTPMADWVGPTHLDEVQYVFGNPYHKNFTPEETELSHRLIDRWSRFAKTGNPNLPGQVPWLQYHYKNPLYMYFGQEEESIRMSPNDRCVFFRDKFDAVLEKEFYLSLTNSVMRAVSYSLIVFVISLMFYNLNAPFL